MFVLLFLIIKGLKIKELLNELDQKSEWRKELMNIAAKPVMNLEDVYRVLASLRFLPKNRIEIKTLIKRILMKFLIIFTLN